MAAIRRVPTWVRFGATAVAIVGGTVMAVLEVGELVALDRGDVSLLWAFPVALAAGGGTVAALLTGAVRQGVREVRGARPRLDVCHIAGALLSYGGVCIAGLVSAAIVGGRGGAVGFALGYVVSAAMVLPVFERARR